MHLTIFKNGCDKMRISDYPVLQELQEEYQELRTLGNNRSDSERIMMERYTSERQYGSEDDGLIFWVGLADAQYRLKELSKSTAEHAMAALEMLSNPEFDIVPGDLKRRRGWYASPMPERTQFRKPRPFRCEWKLGDTFAYQIGGELAQERGIAGMYMLFRKVHELVWSDGKVRPVVTMTLWDRDVLPKSQEEFASVPMLKVRGDITQKCKSGYEFRTQLLFSRKKQTAVFQFIGNFQDIPMPENEIIIHDSAFTPMVDITMLDKACCVYWSRHQQYMELEKTGR